MITSSARQTRFRSRKATTNSRPSKTFVLNFRKAVFYVRWSKKERTFWGTGLGTVFTGNAQCVFSKNSGAGDGIRTRNPQLGKLMRYRCATPAQNGEKIPRICIERH